MDLKTLLTELADSGEMAKMTRNPLAQFGNLMRNRRYLLATLLPEMMKEENAYTEEDIAIRTMPADDVSRYSPAQKKNRIETQSLDIVLGEIGAEREINAKHIDTLKKMMMDGDRGRVVNSLISLFDTSAMQSLQDKKEIQRGQAIVTGKIKYRGPGNKDRIIQFEDPVGHRFTAGGQWSDDAYNPFDDFEKARNLLEEAGYPLTRIISRGKPVNLMQGNASVQTRVGRITIDPNLQLQATGQLAGRDRIREYLVANDFPSIEVYNLDYYTQNSRNYMIPDDVMIFVGATPRNWELSNGAPGDVLLLNNTLGYYGVGTVERETSPGDVIRAYFDERRGGGIEIEAYGTGLPIIQEPEAIVVVKGIS